MKTIRTGVYGLVKYRDKIVVIKKGRGPFTCFYDLPGGKIEHGEYNIESLKRELMEEVGLEENDFKIDNLLSVEEDFVNHIWEGQEKQEHLIAIIYVVLVTKNNLNLDYLEDGGDANGFKLIGLHDTDLPKTNILKKAINRFIGN